MSFTTAIGQSASAGARTLLRGSTVKEMGRIAGAVIGAGALAAVYQITYDEVRLAMSRWRLRAHFRQQRHETLLIALLSAELTPDAQNKIIRSGDAFKASLRLLTDATTTAVDREAIVGAVRKLGVAAAPTM